MFKRITARIFKYRLCKALGMRHPWKASGKNGCVKFGSERGMF